MLTFSFGRMCAALKRAIIRFVLNCEKVGSWCCGGGHLVVLTSRSCNEQLCLSWCIHVIHVVDRLEHFNSQLDTLLREWLLTYCSPFVTHLEVLDGVVKEGHLITSLVQPSFNLSHMDFGVDWGLHGDLQMYCLHTMVDFHLAMCWLLGWLYREGSLMTEEWHVADSNGMT